MSSVSLPHSPAQIAATCELPYVKWRESVAQLVDQVTRDAWAIAAREQLSAWVRGPLRRLIPHAKTLVGFGRIGYSATHIDLVHPGSSITSGAK